MNRLKLSLVLSMVCALWSSSAFAGKADCNTALYEYDWGKISGFYCTYVQEFEVDGKVEVYLVEVLGRTGNLQYGAVGIAFDANLYSFSDLSSSLSFLSVECRSNDVQSVSEKLCYKNETLDYPHEPPSALKFTVAWSAKAGPPSAPGLTELNFKFKLKEE